MFELTINDKVYGFNFGVGFVREVNKRNTQLINGIKKDVGLQYAIAAILDKDILETVELLLIANNGCAPRVSRALLDEYFDNQCEDIDAIFEELLDFFANSNATKQMLANVQKLIEEQKAKTEAEQMK